MIDRLSRSQAKMKRREHSYIERITTWAPELGNDRILVMTNRTSSIHQVWRNSALCKESDPVGSEGPTGAAGAGGQLQSEFSLQRKRKTEQRKQSLGTWTQTVCLKLWLTYNQKKPVICQDHIIWCHDTKIHRGALGWGKASRAGIRVGVRKECGDFSQEMK